MSERLARLMAKVERAGQHLETFYDEFGRVLDEQGAGLFAPVQFDPQSGDYVSKVGEFGETGTRLGILAGDVCHQLRSALDHLVCQLVEANQKTPTTNHALPVRDAPFPHGSFVRTVQGGQLHGVPTAACRLIEDAQPYRATDPSNHWLAILDGMWNADKHRVLLTTFVAPSNPAQLASAYFVDRQVAIKEVRVALKSGQRLETGAEIARIRLASADGKAKVYVEGKVSLHIEIAEGPGLPVANFDVLLPRTRSFIEQFAPFL